MGRVRWGAAAAFRQLTKPRHVTRQAAYGNGWRPTAPRVGGSKANQYFNFQSFWSQ